MDLKINIGNSVAMDLLTLKNQVKVFHWQTTSYAEHKALDKLFGKLNNLNDRWVEVFMGKYGRITLPSDNNTIHLRNFSKDIIQKYLSQWNVYMRMIRDTHFGESQDSDLSNIFDELFSEVNNTLYLLRLQ